MTQQCSSESLSQRGIIGCEKINLKRCDWLAGDHMIKCTAILGIDEL